MIIKKLKLMKEKAIPKDSFRSSVFTLTSGTGFAQLIPILVAPVLTRLYDPADFGLLALYIAIISILSVIATGKYEFAIILPKSDREAMSIFILAILLALVLSLISLICLLCFSNLIAGLPKLSILRGALYYVPLGIFLTGLYQAMNLWLIRKKLFGRLASRRIIQFGSMALFQIIFGFMKLGYNGLILGFIFGQIVSYGILIAQVWKENIAEVRLLSIQDSIKQAFRYKNFLFYSVPSSLCNNLTTESPNFLLNSFFNSTVVGLYDLPRRIISAPAALISDSISYVFQERASRDLKENGDCRDIFIKTFKVLVFTAFLPYLLLFIFSPTLVPFIFGPKWQASGEYARYLSLSGFMIFIASPLGYILLIAEKQVVNLIWQVSFLLVSVIALWLGAYLHSPSLSILYFSLASSIMSIFYIFISYHFTKRKVNIKSYLNNEYNR